MKDVNGRMGKPGESGRNGKRVCLFLFGLILVNYPIVSLFDLDAMLGGIPLAHFYLFSTWTFLIGMISIVNTRRRGIGKVK